MLRIHLCCVAVLRDGSRCVAWRLTRDASRGVSVLARADNADVETGDRPRHRVTAGLSFPLSGYLVVC